MNQEVNSCIKFATEHERESYAQRRREKRKRQRSKKSNAERRQIRREKVEKKRKEIGITDNFKPTNLVQSLVKKGIKLQKKAVKSYLQEKDHEQARKFLGLAIVKFDEARAFSTGKLEERTAFETLYRDIVIQRKYLITK